MKQLDIVVSPPAFLWDPYLTLTDVHKGAQMIYFQRYDFFLVFFSSLPQTDRQADRQKATHMSPLCICTGGLKKGGLWVGEDNTRLHVNKNTQIQIALSVDKKRI